MRKKKKYRERKYKGTAILVCTLIASLVLPSAFNLLARDTLTGIEEQVKEISEREDAAYHILEIVPDRSLARIGFYFGGQEPFLLHEEDGSVLFDAWDTAKQEWKPWQSVLEQAGNREDREYLVNHLMERAVMEETTKDLVMVSGNIAVMSVSGNTILGSSVSGNSISPKAAEPVVLQGEGEQQDAPVILSTYQEVSREEYEASPSEYRKYEIEEQDKKGFFKHSGAGESGGTTYDVTFKHYGAFKGTETGSLYHVVDKIAIPDELDSSWETLLNENAYVKEGDQYTYCGKVGDVAESAEISSFSLEGPQNMTAEEDETEEDVKQKNEEEKESGSKTETGSEAGTDGGAKDSLPMEEDGKKDDGTNGSLPTGEDTGKDTGSDTGKDTGSDGKTSGSGETENGQPKEETLTEVASIAENSTWQLFSAPASSDPEYFYLKMERVAAPAVGDGIDYYMADYKLADGGAWVCEYTAEDDVFADTLHVAADTIYYLGGFDNREWFKRYAYDMEEDMFPSFAAQITTLTTSELNDLMVDKNFSFDNFDFISIRDGKYKEADGTERLGFKDGTDFDQPTAEKLFAYIMTSEKPTVIDSSIVFAEGTADTEKVIHTDMKQKKPNLWRLSALLLQQSPEQFLPPAGTDGKRPEFSWDGNTAVVWSDIENNIGFAEDRDKNYVNQNIYSLFGTTFVNSDFDTLAWNDISLNLETADTNMEGFEDVLLEIESENMYREADASFTGEPLSTNIRQSTVLRYIINYAYQRATYLKTKINILDIEPCYPDEDSFPLTKADVKKWLADDSPITENDITITTMAVSEFIGRNEDLNRTYDLIYIGTDADKLNPGTDGRTVFNDESMNGMVYFHVGDYRYSSSAIGGQLDTEYYDKTRLYEYIKVRYSGLDITKSKMRELISYVDASYPVVLSDDFFQKSEDNTTIINDEYIDNSSYIYEFAEKMQTDKRKNVFSRKMLGGGADGGKANVKLFSFYLNRPKLELVDTNVICSSMGENGVYNIDNKDGQYELEYRFTIHNIGAVSLDTRYRCRLYIDVNADGKFSPLEQVDDISIAGGSEGDGADSLRAGVKYTLKRRVPDGYRGVLAWKIAVSQVNNDNIRTAMTGYSKMTGLEPETIHVLQICRDELWWDGYAGNPWLTGSGGWWAQENNRRMNLEEEFENKGSNYYKLLYGGNINGFTYNGITDDFDLDVKCVTVSEFEKMYADAKDKQSVLRDYNMLILGFSDSYGNLSETSINGPGGITEFIDSGKSVLFAHDTTSFFNFDYGNYGYPDNSFNKDTYGTVDHDGNRKSNYSYERFGTDLPWSYELNRFVRPLVGMDRYGVNELNISKNGEGEVTSVNFTERSMLLKKGRQLTEASPGWTTLSNTAHDIAYKPGSDRKETVPEIQGYTYSIIGLKDRDKSGTLSAADVGSGNTDTKNTLLNYDFKQYLGQKEVSDGAGDSVMNVTKVNGGQITTYPFKLQDKFAVSNTHGQYYQLDMDADDDRDGESDLVVWYCLGENSDGGKNIYSVSPNDVVNNYYIYNKGNITYTGMGHDGRASADPKYVEEAKLFINTIISAYTASIKPSEVKIIDEKTENEINDLYHYYDVGNEKHLDDAVSDYQKVYFTVRDTNFVKGTRNLSAKFYLETESGSVNLSYGGEDYGVNLLEGLPVYRKDNDREDGNDALADSSRLESGGIYYVRIPRELLQDGKTRQAFFVESSSKINRYTEEVVTSPVVDKVDMVQLQLFELD